MEPKYEWMLVGALGHIIAKGVEPLRCMAWMQAERAKGNRDDGTIFINGVEVKNETSTA